MPRSEASKETNLHTPWYWTSNLQNCKKKKFCCCCLSHSVYFVMTALVNYIWGGGVCIHTHIHTNAQTSSGRIASEEKWGTGCQEDLLYILIYNFNFLPHACLFSSNICINFSVFLINAFRIILFLQGTTLSTAHRFWYIIFSRH